MAQTKLQKVRLAAGLSQSQLADKANVPVRTLQHWENGDRDIRKAAVETVLALARALGCDLNEIIETLTPGQGVHIIQGEGDSQLFLKS